MPELSPALPHKKIGVAIIRGRDGKILIDRRKPKGEMAGLWEFPGGKIEPNETVEECIKREIEEELAIKIAVDDLLVTINHSYDTFCVTLFVHNCCHLDGVPQLIECDQVLWVEASQLKEYQFPPANIQIIDLLQTEDIT